jgi:leucyl-tRNA synthetase
LIDWKSIEEKWQKRWEKARLFETNQDPSRPKFFITVAYPYPNSPQHIGHGRTYTIADVHARYKRMKGYNVLFPMGFHYTGTPILAMAKRLSANDHELLDTFVKIYKVPLEKIKEFNEPINIAKYFHEEIKQGMKEIGYSIDWRREFTTIDPHYSRFIEWQFEKLKEKGYIIQGSHPVGWCPNCESPVGQHDTMGDVEPEIGEYTLIKFSLSEEILPTATLRPETIFGVTNIWINPEADYVKAQVNEETWIISKKCFEKLKYLNKNVSIKQSFKGLELMGKFVKNPVTKEEVPILPAKFVDPDNGTGVVMSVPAHAPFDYQALEDLKKASNIEDYGIPKRLVESIKPISIIKLEGYSEFPALDMIKKYGVKNQEDPLLNEATEELYSKEFHEGIMKDNAHEYSGLSVAEARERVKNDLISSKNADKMFEIMNKPVVCRCGSVCVVKIFENQWFIDYGNKEWKALAHECLEKMSIIPEEIRFELAYTIDWLHEKACARKSGLGTKLPWDKEWIIESLSDSVIYMAYYIIANHIRSHRIKLENLSNEFFDFVFLGKGDLEVVSKSSKLDKEVLKELRNEFLYFYPLDSRHSGRDLVSNHLTFFIFNHVAIFPKELWPKQIVVNGSVLMEGKKMSKSLGNIIPLREAIKSFGADPLRIAILISAELRQDANFSYALVNSIQEKLNRLYSFVEEVIEMKNNSSDDNLTFLDEWLISKANRLIFNVTEAMEKLKIREAILDILYNFDQDIQWYMKRISANNRKNSKTVFKILNEVLEIQIRLLTPFAPHFCEEIWEKLGKSPFVSNAEWPVFNESKINIKAEETEEMIKSLLDDTKRIIKAVNITPKKICYYTADSWKWKAYLKLLKEITTGNIEFNELIKKLFQDPEIEIKGKELIEFLKKTMEEALKMSKELKEKRMKISFIDEFAALQDALKLFEKEFNSKVELYRESDPKKYDPKNRSKLAKPYRPAIYIE